METIDEIKKLFVIIGKLQNKYKNRKFTLDGRLVGDIGEVIVERDYNVILFENMEKIHDGYSGDKKVQIKATFKDSLTFPDNENKIPEYYIGIKINNDGTYEEIYNGPGINIWNMVKNRSHTPNSLHSININTLRNENKKISNNEKIKKKKK
jgi:hypothetical protein